MLPIMVYFLIASIKFNRVDSKLTFGIRFAIFGTALVFVAVSALHAYHNSYHFGGWKNLSSTIIGYKDDPSSKPKTAIGFFNEARIPFGVYTLLLSRDRGLLLYSPILLLGFVSILTFRKKIPIEHWILLSMMVSNILLYSSWDDPWGGWAFGPRYLIPSMAILSIYVGFFLHLFKYRMLGKVMVFILFSYSGAVALLGALTTNAVPTKIEGDFLGMKSTYAYNWVFLKANQSGSFVYNVLFENRIPLLIYGLVILGLLLAGAAALLFILPRYEKFRTE
jgi:hypothetical protein